jgi:Cysteine-rich secretory protein family
MHNAHASEPRRTHRRPLAIFAAGLATLSLGIGSLSAPSKAQAQADASWLEITNAYRTSVGLKALEVDAALQAGVDKHVEYLSATGSLQHGEAAGNPLYSPDGDLAGQQSILGGWTGAQRSNRELIDGWLTAPFHAIHLFEPRLQRVAFASVQGRTGNKLPSAAVMNIIGGVGPKVGADRPIVFPGRDSVIPLTSFVVETPDPLTHCPGYSAPAGLGLMALFPLPITSATATLSANGQPLEHCVIDTSYRNPDPAAEKTVRTILGQKNAVVIMPRQPLVPGTTYDVSITAGAQQVSWKFTAAEPGSALPRPAAEPMNVTAVTRPPKNTKPAPTLSKTKAGKPVVKKLAPKS